MIIPFQLLRLALWTLSLVFGSIGIFSLYFSFYVPVVALIAVLMLILATAMAFVLQERR
jgi:hypothetical protein